MEDYYKILEVNKDASEEEIKKSYRKLAMKYHPDRTNGDIVSEEKFKKISEAYDTLSDTDKKQAYDNPQSNFLNDLFSSMGGFGGGQFRQQRRNVTREDLPKKGIDIRHHLNTKVANFILGGKVEININYEDWCEECNGNGGKNIIKCPECGGTGMKNTISKQGSNTFSSFSPCKKCNGQGMFYEKQCEKCGGRCRIPNTKKVMVTIPSGIKDGMGMRLPGIAGKGTNGAPNGDVLVKINMVYPDISKLTEEQISLLKEI